MVIGGLPKLMPGQVCLRRQSNCVQWSACESLLSKCDSFELRQRCHSVRYKVQRRRSKVLVIAGKKSTKKKVEVAVKAQLAQIKAENLSNQSAAAPAADMDMMEESGGNEETQEEEQEDEFSRYRGLVLDLAYRPINVVNWQRALCLEILEKAEVLEYYDQVIHSPNKIFFIPAVLKTVLLNSVSDRFGKVSGLINTPKHKQVRITLNRKNIFLRDKYKCQYCSANENLTIDHVFAASRGGGWTWDNLKRTKFFNLPCWAIPLACRFIDKVTACSPCNVKKASKTLEEARMKLLGIPKEPKLMENLPPNIKTYKTLRVHQKTPMEWVSYLPGTVSMFQ